MGLRMSRVSLGLGRRSSGRRIAHGGKPRRVLVVDDYRDWLDVMRMGLELRGHVVATAYDGRSALAIAETFRPEVVLLDIGLPDFDGHDLALRLGQLPSAREARLVALTGWDGAACRARSQAQGFVAHLTKPVDMALILDIIDGMPCLGEALVESAPGV